MTDDTQTPRDPERNRLSGRIARSARVGANLSGAGLTFATQSLFGGDQGDEKIARALAAALGKSKGPLMKVAQMVSTIPDFLPPEYAAELSQLQAEAPAMGWPFVKRRMRAELGADWQEKFGAFEKEASHAASLGQVHGATLHDGRRVACKLQYPDMASAVESDIGQLRTMLGLFKRMDGSIDPSAMVVEITDRLREELDYAREAKHMALYANMLADRDFVTVPDPVPELSTDRLLTMSWVSGKRLDAFEDAPRYLEQQPFARLAIANPKTAPYGLAAQQVLEHIGQWQPLQPKLVRGDSIAQTFQFVVSRNAQAGFVAASQVKVWDEDAGTLWQVPQAYYQPIDQQAILLNRGASNEAARAWMDFLKSDTAIGIIRSYGYDQGHDAIN